MKHALHALILWKTLWLSVELSEPLVYWLADVVDERFEVKW